MELKRLEKQEMELKRREKVSLPQRAAVLCSFWWRRFVWRSRRKYKGVGHLQPSPDSLSKVYHAMDVEVTHLRRFRDGGFGRLKIVKGPRLEIGDIVALPLVPGTRNVNCMIHSIVLCTGTSEGSVCVCGIGHMEKHTDLAKKYASYGKKYVS